VSISTDVAVFSDASDVAVWVNMVVAMPFEVEEATTVCTA